MPRLWDCWLPSFDGVLFVSQRKHPGQFDMPLARSLRELMVRYEHRLDGIRHVYVAARFGKAEFELYLPPRGKQPSHPTGR